MNFVDKRTTTINPTVVLVPVLRTLETRAFTLDQLWLDHAPVWQQLGWNLAQVNLWLLCLPNVQAVGIAQSRPLYQVSAAQNPENQLADQMVALLEANGRPMPLEQLIGKLPAGWVVTEPMLRNAANKDHRLELRGPLVKLI